MERLMKPFRLRSSKDRKPLSEEQKRKRAGFVVYPLMFLLCLGSFYLIFSPSGQERERQDKGQGFNTEIPSPEDSRLEGNKKDAYEKALMEQESRKRKTFFEAAESMFAKEERKDSVRLPDNIPPERQTNTETETEKGNAGPVSSSAGAYREMNRTLGSIYEPRTDPEKERLLERIEELERMQQQQQKQEPLSGMEEKMALMEKSYELAAKYNNRQAVETPSPVRKAEDKKAIPVKQVHNEVVSSLSRPMSDEEFISAFSGERNAGFNTAVGRKTVTEGNTIAACVHGTQTVSDGQALRLRLTEPMSVAGRFIPKGTVLVVAVTNSSKHDFYRCKSATCKFLFRDTKSARDKNGTKPRKNKVKNTSPEISLVEYLCFVCKGTNLSLEKRGKIPISLIHNSFSYHCTQNVVIASDFDLKQHDLRISCVKFCFALCWTFSKTRTGNRTKDLPPLLSNSWLWECLNDRHLKMLNFK